MVNADEYYGEYLKADDVKKEISVSIEKVNLETIDGDKKLVIELTGFTKKFVLNKTNKDRLKELLGTSETDQWINKEFKLHIEPAMFKGEEVPSLRVIKKTEGG